MSSLDALLDNAFTAYNEGRLETAESLAREVLSVAPTHGDGLYLLGLIALQSRALDPAADLLYQAVKLYPDMENYALALASVLHKQGHLDEALSFYEKHKQTPAVLVQIGMIYAQKSQDDWATSAFEGALNQQSDTPEALMGLAILARKGGNLERAEYLLKRADAANPTLDVAYQLALTYRMQGAFDKALLMIEQASSVQKTAMVLNEYGLILQGLGQDDKALDMYQAASDENPYFADAYFNAGNVYQRQGKAALAEDAYKRALTQDKKFLQAHLNLASLLYKQNRVTESLNHLQEAVILNPRSIAAVYNLAVILEERGEWCEAAGLYFNALSLGMTDPVLPFRIHATLLGLAHQGDSEKKQAIQFAKGWVKNFPNDVVARHTLAILSGHASEVADDFARTFYDVFAASYDEKIAQLESKALSEVIKILPQKSYKKILDLGCGTGSFALKFNQNFKSIIGLDIAPGMIERVRQTNQYDTLVCETAAAFLSRATDMFDLIVAVELTGYLDELDTLFQGVKTHLTSDGVFAFTVECAPEKMDKMLALNGRYVYGKTYVEKRLHAAGLKIQKIKEIDLRREGNAYAKGFVVLAMRVG